MLKRNGTVQPVKWFLRFASRAAHCKLGSRFGRPAETLFSYIWHQTARQQIPLAVMSALSIPLAIAPIELQRRIIDDGITEKNEALLVQLIMLYACVAILHAGLLYLLNLKRGTIHERVARRLRQVTIRRHTSKVNKREKENAGTAIAVITSEADPIGEFSGQAFSLPLINGGIFAAMFGYMLYTQPLLAGVAILLFAPQLVLIPRIQKKINLGEASRIGELRAAGDRIAGDKVGPTDRVRRDIFGHIRQVYRERRGIYRLKYRMKYGILLLDYAAQIGVLGIGGYLCMQGQVGVGVIVAFLSSLERLRRRWKEFVDYFRQKELARVKYDLIRELFQSGSSRSQREGSENANPINH